MMPDHLDYLKSYFRTELTNPLFPFTLIGSSALAVMLGYAAFAAPAGSGQATSYLLLLVLAMLGVIENCILMVPLRSSALWTWAKPRAADSNISRLALIGTANQIER
jgi:putative photosynthetic complex assembly protein 2